MSEETARVDLSRINFRDRSFNPALENAVGALTELTTEMGYLVAAFIPRTRNVSTVLLVRTAATEAELRKLAEDPEQLLGFVSEGAYKSHYVATLEAMVRVLTKDTDKADDVTATSDQSAEVIERTDGVHPDEPVYRAHATVVEYDGRAFVVALCYNGDNVSQRHATWACEQVLGCAIADGLFVELSTPSA